MEVFIPSLLDLGDQGLVSVRATVQYETTKTQDYVRKMAPKDELLNKHLRQ